MKTVTIDQIMAREPCEEYPRERVEELFAGRESLTALELLDLEIPFQDRLWVFCKCGLLSAKDLRLFACDCAESALHIFEGKNPGDSRPREAISVARRYAVGDATSEELSSAWSAAWSAACDAASSAARGKKEWAKWEQMLRERAGVSR